MEKFVGIGAQKSGTTWLYDQLINHPEVCLPELKEVHYFDMFTEDTVLQQSGAIQRIKNARSAIAKNRPGNARLSLDVLELAFRGDDAYVDYISKNANDQTKVVGEITPEYAALNEVGFAHLKRVLDPKIVFVMRDPLERYWSMVKMAVKDDTKLENRFATMIEQPGFWSRSDYARTIDLVDSMFDPERVLYLFYEELFTQETMDRLLDFLGVSSMNEFGFNTRSLQGRVRDMPPIPENVKSRLEPIYSKAEKRFGSSVPATWGRSF